MPPLRSPPMPAGEARARACRSCRSPPARCRLVRAAARDDVDDAADRVGAVQRRARALDDLDALDELGRDVLHRRRADGAGIDAQAVDQHQHVVRLRAAQEQRSLLAGAAEARHLDAGHEAQRVAEVGGRPRRGRRGESRSTLARTSAGGTLGARGGDDDGFECRAAGGSGKQYQVRSSVLLPSGDFEFTGRGGIGEEKGADARTPVSPAATGAVLTGRSPDSRRVARTTASPSHRNFRQWLQDSPA